MQRVTRLAADGHEQRRPSLVGSRCMSVRCRAAGGQLAAKRLHQRVRVLKLTLRRHGARSKRKVVAGGPT
jgi:hypothetical protein